jgi:hypothetical protein
MKRAPFLLFAVINLILGLMAGLGRMGLPMPVTEAYAHHGAIMVGGFLGTLIALEKVIPLKRKFFYAGPLLSAASLFAFLFGSPGAGLSLQIGAGLVFIAVYRTYLSKQFNVYLLLAMAGACCWVIGNIFLLREGLYPKAFPWWMGFLLLTIVSERLELTRFLPVSSKAKKILYGALGLFLLGAILPYHDTGRIVLGFSLTAVSLWLLRYDIVRISVRKQDLTRFTAVGLLSGYFYLLADGVFLTTGATAVWAYDVVLHLFFLGFVFSMIFAHGPVILPGVLALQVRPYSSLLYIPLAVLTISIVLRACADAGLLDAGLRELSGWMSAGSILLYFAILAGATLREIHKSEASS